MFEQELPDSRKPFGQFFVDMIMSRFEFLPNVGAALVADRMSRRNILQLLCMYAVPAFGRAQAPSLPVAIDSGDGSNERL